MHSHRPFQSAVLSLAAGCLLAVGSVTASAAELIHYDFDRSAVNVANPGTYDGTLVNGPTYVNGQINEAIAFTGAAQVVNSGALPSTLGIGGGASRTLMGWANIAAFNNGGIFSMGSPGANSTDFALRTTTTTNGFRAQFWGNADFDFTYNNALNNWVHYTLVYDQTTTTAKVYLNGGAPSSGTQSEVSSPVLNTGDNQAFQVGNWRTDYLIGLVDDVRVFDTALTQQQVVAYMNAVTDSKITGVYGPVTEGARVRVVNGAAGSVTSTSVADSLLVNGSLPGNARGLTSVVNLGTSNADNLFTTPAKTSFPAGTAGDDFGAEISGMFYIPTAGDYVLGVNSDDGFQLQIGNQLDTVMQFAGTTSKSDQRKAFHFDSAGYVPYRLVFSERGGGNYVEFWSKAGADTTDLTGAALVGDTANGGLATIATGSFIVRDVQSTGAIGNLAAAEALLAGTGVASSVRTFTSVIDFHDATNTSDHFNVDAAFPGGQGRNEFALEAVTRLLITEGGTYTFGARTDDGSTLQIDGQTVFFDDVQSDLHDVFGTITLAAGFHDLRYVFFEHTGGAAAELFAAKGTFTSFDANAFRLVGDVANGGIAVFAAPMPAAAPMGLLLLTLASLKRRR